MKEYDLGGLAVRDGLLFENGVLLRTPGGTVRLTPDGARLVGCRLIGLAALEDAERAEEMKEETE